MLTAIIFPRFHHHLQNDESEATEDSLKAVAQNNLWTKADFEDDTNHCHKMADTTEKIRIELVPLTQANTFRPACAINAACARASTFLKDNI